VIRTFATCDGSREQFWFWNGDPVIAILDTGDVVARSSDGSMVSLTTIDPCKPWYVRITRQPIQGGSASVYEVWQALDPEPGPLLVSNTTDSSEASMSLFNLYAGDAAHSVQLDLIDVTNAPSG
jgi:hypothetical protein